MKAEDVGRPVAGDIEGTRGIGIQGDEEEEEDFDVRSFFKQNRIVPHITIPFFGGLVPISPSDPFHCLRSRADWRLAADCGEA
jgi:hypothetical protein